ncbi:MAG: hypothetical protein AAGA03_19435, partial [Planctomycetota bacterium]
AAAKESDPTRVDLAQFADQYDVTLATADGQVQVDTVVGQTRNEIWPWVAAAVFALLIAEYSLANRTAA